MRGTARDRGESALRSGEHLPRHRLSGLCDRSPTGTTIRTTAIAIAADMASEAEDRIVWGDVVRKTGMLCARVRSRDGGVQVAVVVPTLCSRASISQFRRASSFRSPRACASFPAGEGKDRDGIESGTSTSSRHRQCCKMGRVQDPAL